MKKAILIATVVAVAFGGAGFAIGIAAGARADHERERETVTVTRTVTIPAPAIPAPAIATPAPVVPVVREPAVREVREGERRDVIRVRRLVITSAIAEREPVDTIGTMSVGEHERVYAFVDLANRGEAGSVFVTFERDDAPPHGQVELEVPSRVARHRTWAFTRGVRRAGEWRAIVRDAQGTVLAEEAFVVE